MSLLKLVAAPILSELDPGNSNGASVLGQNAVV